MNRDWLNTLIKFEISDNLFRLHNNTMLKMNIIILTMITVMLILLILNDVFNFVEGIIFRYVCVSVNLTGIFLMYVQQIVSGVEWKKASKRVHTQIFKIIDKLLDDNLADWELYNSVIDILGLDVPKVAAPESEVTVEGKSN